MERIPNSKLQTSETEKGVTEKEDIKFRTFYDILIAYQIGWIDE